MISVSSTYSHVPPLPPVSPPITPPPLTPTVTAVDRLSNPSPALSDDSSLELPFPYERNAAGEWVRLSSYSAKSSPPSSEQPSPLTSDSPHLDYPLPSTSRRSSLSRSESAPTIEPAASARHLQRVASGPLASALASTPATASTRVSLLSAAIGTGRKVIGGARRVRLEDVKETNARARAEVEELKQRELKMQLHGKENAQVLPVPSSFTLSTTLQPLSEVNAVPQRALSVQGRHVLPVPTRRLVKKIEPISETEDVPDEAGKPHPSLVSSAGIRPRRSASLSEAHDGLSQPPQFQNFSRLVPSAIHGARRVTIEEKIRQEREIALEEGYARREAEEVAEAERRAHALNDPQPAETVYTRQSPSPTHLSVQVHSAIHHQRRDSDTLKSMVASMVTASSPTIVEAMPARRSPSNLGYSVNAAPNARHRRSPTAPEPPTTSGMIAPPGLSNNAMGRTWAAGDLPESDREHTPEEVHMAPPPLQGAPSMSSPPLAQRQAAQPVSQKASAAQSIPGARTLFVNKKSYFRVDMIGKGGSSRVYRVLNMSNELYAIKKVALDKTDAETMNGYMNEIALLKRLDGNRRIIRLVDSEVKAGPSGSKGSLLLVMECGEIDLARLLHEQQKESLDIVWVAYYWKQMIQAVHVIHEEKIVHSDLKPANFVLVRGQVKLIDFGIANAIANDTTNIHRESQIGTLNYMSPEAIGPDGNIPEENRRYKVGRASDVWSLGCILYQMVYGQPPFGYLAMIQKLKAITDEAHEIDYPQFSTPVVPRATGSTSPPQKLDHVRVPVARNVIETIMSCLRRNPKERDTIPELLSRDWLANGGSSSEAPAQPISTPPPPALKPDETVINPYFMQQLLMYGINLGLQGRNLQKEELEKEAERLVKELQGVHATPQS